MTRHRDIDAHIQAACDIAATDLPPQGPEIEITADTLSARRIVWRRTGCGTACDHPLHWPAWYELVTHFGPTPALPDAIARGPVRPGEIVAEQPHYWPGDGVARRQVRAVYLVADGPNGPLVPCVFRRRRPRGLLTITLPDGREVERPDPRP